MRLFIKSESGKVGLVPVKKMVTRNGKSFMQTFYFSPGKVPKKTSRTSSKKKVPRPVPKKKKRSEYLDDVVKHIVNTVLDQAYDKALRSRVLGWARKHIKSVSDAKSFIKDTTSGHAFKMEIAMKGNMSIEDASETATALLYIRSKASAAHGDTNIHKIESWWNNLGNPILHESELWGLFEPGAITHEDALSYMINNNMDVLETIHWLVEASESEESEQFENFGMTDKDGMYWDFNDLKAIGEWVQGDATKAFRNSVKVSDKRVRAGLNPKSDNYSYIGDVIDSHKTSSPISTFYRGTTNIDWINADIGDTLPLGIASFSHSQDAAKAFAKEGGIVIILENEYTSESHKVMGVDIPALIKEVNNVGNIFATESGIDLHEDEAEFIVRAPSLRINRVEKDSRFNYVYTSVAEMGLLKSLSYDKAALLLSMESLFDEPLHRKKDEINNKG